MKEELCDKEKSYHEWVSKNLKYISQHKDSISVMQKLYMEGFAAGFHYKQQLRAEEYLQK
jgi:hypothetical protein